MTMSGQAPNTSLLPYVPAQLRRLRLDFTYAWYTGTLNVAHLCAWEALEEALAHAEHLELLELQLPYIVEVPRDHADAIRKKLSPRLRKIVQMVMVL